MAVLRSMWFKQEHAPFGIADVTRPAVEQSVAEEDHAHRSIRFIARQAIFDRKRLVFGYELLFRSGWENRFIGDSDTATRMIIADGALYGFQELTRGTLSFINCTREALVDGLVTLLPKSTVLEILETVEPDEEVINACHRVKQQGYKIALDDFRMNEKLDSLVNQADYIKVDFRLSDKEERKDILAYLKDKPVTLLAEKVETEEEFQMAMEEGFQLFQGYFFCQPTVFSKKKMPTNGTNYLRLLTALSNDSFNVSHITGLVKSEVAICYQLLRLVNSAAFGVEHQIYSIQDALVLVGEDQFRKLVINAIATETCKGRPEELLIHVLHRARFLELMATYTAERSEEQYLFGLLSLMGVMLDTTLDTIVELLPLRQELKDGLTGESNNVTIGLRLLESYEEGDWSACMERAADLGMTEGRLTELYEQSLHWAERAVKVKA